MVSERRAGIYDCEILEDLDSIPFPFRNYPEGTLYFDCTMPTPQPQLQIYGSKGCPFKCSYCLWPQTMYKGRVSLRRPEKIAEEIRQSVAEQGYKSIFFDDDTFNMGNERISVLCDHLKDNKFQCVAKGIVQWVKSAATQIGRASCRERV